MPKQPLTSAGVQAKTTELYALSDADLALQTDVVRADFRAWVANNFILTTEQQTHLADLNDKWVHYAACQTAMAMEHRLEINLIVAEPESASKLIGSANDMTVTDNGGVLKVSGSLLFSIKYE